MPQVVIIGAGVTGLATGFWLQQRAPHVDFVVLEAREQAGGNVGTEEVHGFRVERGPNGFLDRSPALPQLIEALGLKERLIAASTSSRRHRFLCVGERLYRLPTHPLGLLSTPLLSWRGKWELLRGVWRRVRRSADSDETVYDFVARRFGREAADLFADALVTGIQGGDAKQLSLAACFPRLARWERDYGQVVRGWWFESRQRRHYARQHGLPPPAPPRLWSFPEGLQGLIAALAHALGGRLLLGTPVTALEPLLGPAGGSSGRWRIHCASAAPQQAQAVVLACPAYVQSSWLASFDPTLAAEVAAIPYNRIAVVALGYRQVDCPSVPDGFGYIAPQAQGRDVLGVQWCSAIFPQRAPAGLVLWRALCGGVRRAEMLDWDDATLLQAVHQEMVQVLRVRAAPVFHRIIRWPRAIPQYVVGHLQRLTRIEAHLRRWPGLFLSGNAYRGIALSDCAEEAERIVTQLVGLFPPDASH
jgi:oxygen-dependent protoporphyrinogen oxidase